MQPERGFEGLPGNVRPIVQYDDPVLLRPCAPVESFDTALRQLVADMLASMYEAEGVGLAANQIGVPLRVFVYDCLDADHALHRGVVVNPVLHLPAPADRRLDSDEEGCLSVVGQHANLARPDVASVTGVDAHGRPVRVDGTGTLARCLQHEADHLEGTLYIDRLPGRVRRKILRGHAATLAERLG